MTGYDSTQETLTHITKVQARLQEVCNALIVRAANHDRSKLAEPEKSAFDRIGPPNATTYSRGGVITPEYQQFLDTLGSALDHHYSVNSHHPQHFTNGMNGMSLLDLVEWFCDIKAAGERYEDGNLEESLRANKGRFKISDQLAEIFENTRKELGW